MQTKAEAVANSADMTEKEKANSIAKLVANAAKAPKRKKAEIKTVVARGANRVRRHCDRPGLIRPGHQGPSEGDQRPLPHGRSEVRPRCPRPR